MRYISLCCLLLVVLAACTPKETVPVLIPNDTVIPEYKPRKILFLGHTYQHYTHNKLDPNIDSLDLSGFDNFWLGGDICRETTSSKKIIEYIDDKFNVSDTNTHWAYGNHDLRNDNWEWLEDVTGRPTFYTHHHKGLTVMVLNTYLHPNVECEMLDPQFEMIEQVLDTITHSSHLVILTHHVIWGAVDPDEMQLWRFANAHYPHWRSRCTDPFHSEFIYAIYPKIVEVRNRGVKVICIAGDFGIYAKSFQFLSDEGVWFLGAGLDNSVEKDSVKRALLPPEKVIYLEHNEIERTLEWEFRNVALMDTL